MKWWAIKTPCPPYLATWLRSKKSDFWQKSDFCPLKNNNSQVGWANMFLCASAFISDGICESFFVNIPGFYFIAQESRILPLPNT